MRRFYPRKKSYAKKAVKAKDVEQDRKINRLTKMVNTSVEQKITGQELNNYTSFYQTTPQLVLLNGLARGTSSTTRIGNKVKFTKLEMRISLASNGSNFDQENLVRVILFREKSPAGQAPSLLSMFTSTTPWTHNVFDYTNRDFAHSFSIMYDKTFDLSGQSPFSKMLIINKKLNFVTNYSRDVLGTVADMDSNSFYMLLITDRLAATVLAMNYKFDYNLYYVDS